ncbi:hypothetical protein FPC831_170009 [Flavobacterium psychrophilum]|nr:hypothetical protein FPC831_170009 [Flavobacterium psychrophilum]
MQNLKKKTLITDCLNPVTSVFLYLKTEVNQDMSGFLLPSYCKFLYYICSV